MAQIYFSQPCECGCGQIANSTDRRLSRRRRFIHGHRARLQSKRILNAPPPNPSGLCQCGCGRQTKRAKKSRGTLQVAGEFLRYLQGHWEKWEARRNPVKPDDPRGPNPSGKCGCGCGQTTSIADRTDAAEQTVAGCYHRFLKGHDKLKTERIGNPSGFCKCGCGQKTPIAKFSRLGNIASQPQMYCPGHRWQHQYVINRNTGCWELPPDKVHGYGRIRRDGRLWLAHRWYWSQRYGPIPEGMTLDHLCRNRACCNPDHMELCTQAENSRRVANHPEIPKWGDWDDSQIIVDPATQCWLFPIVQQDGYARFWMRTRLIPAHIYYYTRERGKIPSGLQLDHMCRRRNCVCPSHLEPVTRTENMRRAAASRAAALAA